MKQGYELIARVRVPLGQEGRDNPSINRNLEKALEEAATHMTGAAERSLGLPGIEVSTRIGKTEWHEDEDDG